MTSFVKKLTTGVATAIVATGAIGVANVGAATLTAPPQPERAAITLPATPAQPELVAVDTAPDSTDQSDTDDVNPDPRQVECMAKVVMHEAGNQPRKGQVAVAQTIRNRMNDPRFAKTACGVIGQPGQFFNVDAYDPPRHDGRWEKAVDIATETLSGDGDEVVPGALFFHSGGVGMPNRTRVARIADHVFFR